MRKITKKKSVSVGKRQQNIMTLPYSSAMAVCISIRKTVNEWRAMPGKQFLYA